MFTKAIYNKQGHPVAWKDGNFIFNLKGKQLLIFLEDNAVFTFNGKYLGYFSHGFFRDKIGWAVACTSFEQAGPVLPSLHSAIPVVLDLPVYPLIVNSPPSFPVETLAWSNISWQEFIGQHRKLPAENLGIFYSKS